LSAGISLFYLFWVTIHVIDFFIQSLVYYLLVMFETSTRLLLCMDWRRGVYLLAFSAGCVWLENKLKKNLKLFQTIRNKKWIQIAGCVVATGLMIYFQRIYILLVSDRYLTFWTLFLLLVVMVIVGGAIWMQKVRVEERERVQQVKLQLLETNYEQATRMYKEKASLLHDEKHHINAIYELLSQGEIDRAIQYTEDMTRELNRSGTRIWSNNVMLDLILNAKRQEAELKQIDVDIKFDDMSNLVVDDVDLCALISNILDNAIEANQKLDDADKRWIKFYGERKGDIWIINSSNPISDPVLMKDGRLMTSKSDRHAHGYGIESMRRVLDKYFGDMNIVIEEDKFVLTLYMTAFK